MKPQYFSFIGFPFRRIVPFAARVFLLFLLPIDAGLAEYTTSQTNIGMKPMQFVLMRDARAGCAPTCAEWIAAQGKIVPGTAAQFNGVLRSIGSRKLPIFIDSHGGSVEDAMTMGRALRSKHLDVVVTKSELIPCVSGDKACRGANADGSQPGVPHGVGALCASACVLVLAAGEKRDVAAWAFVGVHQIIMQETLTRTERLFRIVYRRVGNEREVLSRTFIGVRPISKRSFVVKAGKSTYDNVAAYLSAMGISPGLIPLMQATPASGIHWMTAGELQTTRTVTDRIDGGYLIGLIETKGAAPASLASIETRRARERAYLVLAPERAGEKAKPIVGTVDWFLDQPKGASVAAAVLRAEVDIPEAKLKFTMRMQKAQPADTEASQIMQMAFTLAPDGLVPSIFEISMPQARDLSPPQNFDLDGSLLRISPTAYKVRLADKEANSLLNESMVEARPWLVVPMLIAGVRNAGLYLEHAGSGQALIEQAFRDWQTLPPRPAPPPPPQNPDPRQPPQFKDDTPLHAGLFVDGTPEEANDVWRRAIALSRFSRVDSVSNREAAAEMFRRLDLIEQRDGVILVGDPAPAVGHGQQAILPETK
jgi:hypothetical protein